MLLYTENLDFLSTLIAYFISLQVESFMQLHLVVIALPKAYMILAHFIIILDKLIAGRHFGLLLLSIYLAGLTGCWLLAGIDLVSIKSIQVLFLLK